ncbi:MAG: anti-sigma factor [Planctomycetales bacterium]|nr:anti-sigma factor [Planctomycetales bacterium]MCA9166824.1 anti-sigma factor [Planctomycetales bacterium]
MSDCKSCRDKLPELSLQPLEDPMPLDVERHLGQCEECRTELVALRRAWCSLTPSDAIRDPARAERIERQLFERISAHTTTVPVERRRELSSVVVSRRTHVLRFGLAVAVFALIVTSHYLTAHRSLDHLGELTASERRHIEDVAKKVDMLHKLEQSYGSPHLQHVSMITATPSKSASRAEAHLVIDGDSREVLLLAANFHPTTSGRYVMWLLAPNGDVLSSTPLDVHDDGYGAASAQLRADEARIAKALVTLESLESPARPSHDIIVQVQFDRERSSDTQ